jgi:hypothetical protein
VAGELWLASYGWRIEAGYIKGYFMGGSVRVIEDIFLSERDGGGGGRGHGKIIAVRLCKEKRARAGSRNGIQESPGFNKNIKKSGPLIIGIRGLALNYSSLYYYFYSSSIYILII